MFIARSAAKIRGVRLAFLVTCLLPFGLLVGWAVERRSERHRAAIVAEAGRVVGAAVTIDVVEHLRPGVVRLRGVVVAGADGRPLLTLPAVEVEDSGAEVRLRVERLACDAAAARWLVRLGWEWLGQDARFPRTCLVDVAELTWHVGGTAGDSRPVATDTGRRSLRVECVARPQARAIRCIRSADGNVTADLVKIVRSLPTPEATASTPQWEVDIAWQEPVPLSVAATLLGGGELSLGVEASVAGTLHASSQGGPWEGTAQARLTGLDLAACGTAVGMRAMGRATVDVSRVAWSGDRLRECDLQLLAGPGRIEQRWLEAVVTALGCRAGPAFQSLANDTERSFDVAGCVLRVNDRGCSIVSPAPLSGPLVVAAGLSVLDPPAGPVPAERLAWLLAPPRAVQVPSHGPGAWLMSRLPEPVERAGSPASTSRPPAAIQAEQPGRRGGI